MKLFAAALLAFALPAFGQDVPAQLAGQLHEKCVAHAEEILRRDWHISPALEIDTPKFCECAEKDADYAHILSLVAKVPESERQPGSRPGDALDASYFMGGLRCYSRLAGWADWSDGLPVRAGARSLEEVRVELGKRKGALYAAYNQALKRNPKLAGKVVLEFTIEASGAVDDVRIRSSELNDPEFLDAIQAIAGKMQFPPEPVQKLVTTYPLDFLPG